MIEEFFIVQNVVGIIGIVVDIVLGDGVDMDIAARQLQTYCLDEAILSTACRAISRVVGDALYGRCAGDSDYLARPSLYHLRCDCTYQVHQWMYQGIK